MEPSTDTYMDDFSDFEMRSETLVSSHSSDWETLSEHTYMDTHMENMILTYFLEKKRKKHKRRICTNGFKCVRFIFIWLISTAMCIPFIYKLLFKEVLYYDPFCHLPWNLIITLIYPLFVWSTYRTIFTSPVRKTASFRLTPKEFRDAEAYFNAEGEHTVKMKQRLDEIILSRKVIFRSDKQDSLICFVCKALRPERTEHCEKCRTCVVRRHHHSTFFGNCIHYDNYRSYTMTLFYGTLFSALAFLAAANCSFSVNHKPVSIGPFFVEPVETLSATHWIFYFISIVYFVFMFLLCIIHFVLALRDAMKNYIPTDRTVYTNLGDYYSYDMGNSVDNLKESFGRIKYSWCCPGSLTGFRTTFEFRLRPEH